MRKKIVEENYKKILPFIAKLNEEGYAKLKSSEYMDLVIEKIGDNEYSFAHYYEQEGDLMADPEVTLKINDEKKAVETLTYYNAGIGLYQEVYPTPKTYYPKLRMQLNSFLGDWLNNLINQGFITENSNEDVVGA